MAKVSWSQEAREDLEDIYLQYCKYSDAFAQKWTDEIFDVTLLLETNPRLGRVLPETKIASIREMIIGKYRLVYQINKENIEILTLRHSSKPFSEY